VKISANSVNMGSSVYVSRTHRDMTLFC